jgi:hypothetical protein
MNINALIDEVFLDVFHFYVVEARIVLAWKMLANVCKR